MTLVTDAGYSSHAEIVWESLIDVKGAANELFSGDFRVVSHHRDTRSHQGNAGGGQANWRASPSRNSSSRTGVSEAGTPPPLPGPRPGPASTSSGEAQNTGPRTDEQRRAAEQQDHDLALALQLQEEEEDQQRQADERRRREQQLSENFLSNEPEGPRPAIPPRRTGGRTGPGSTTNMTARPGVNRPSDQSDNPDAPPTYEQSASDMPYRPAGSTAPGTMAQGNPLGAYDALRRQHSAFAQSSSSVNSQPPPGHGRGRRRSWRCCG